MANHLIIYGHGAGDPGAVGNGTNERDYNRKILHPYMKKWADKSKDSFVFFDTTGNRDMFQETANGWGMYSISPSYYATISEYHEDAASSSATGGHVIVSSSFKADKTDNAMAQLIKRIVGLWGGVADTNGISYRSNLLNLNVAAQRGLNYRLTEIGFITSSRDMSIINRELDQLSKGFIESITGENLGGNNVTKPEEKPKQPAIVHTEKPRHNVRVYWFNANNDAGLAKLKRYCDARKLNYKETKGKDGRIMLEIFWFVQWSDQKKWLLNFIEDSNWNYDIEVERK